MGKLFILDEEVICFINCVKESKCVVFEGIVIVEVCNVMVFVVFGEKEMLVSMVVIGVYGGCGLCGNELVYVLV